MREIDVLLDEHPELSLEMVEMDNRNRMAQKELSLYNDHKTFLYKHHKHPIVEQRKQYDDQLAELYEMKRTSPDAFLKEITNVTQNIRRIKSNINKKRYKDENEKASWEKNLSQAETREAVLKEIIGK